jgi:hypothetical protein
MAAQQTNINPWQLAMDFAQFKAKIYDDLTGSKSEIVQQGTFKAPDGSEYPNLIQVTRKDPTAIPVCNDNGARRVIHQIDLIMNPHTSFAELSRDEIPDIAENSIGQAIDVMMANTQEYGVTDLNKLESEGLSLFDTFYIFLTTLKNGGAKVVAMSLYQIKVESKNEAAEAQKGLLNG